MTEDTTTSTQTDTVTSAVKPAGHPVRVGVNTVSNSVGRAGAPVRTSAPAPSITLPTMPGWAVAVSVFWLAVSLGYLFAVGGFSGGAGAVGGIIAGIAAPLVVVWLIAFMQQRALEVDIITQPIRRQLNALLSPSATTDVRIRRITEALAEQAEMLRNAANVALEDSSAAMTAITRQSGELRRLSAEAMLDIGKVGKTAEQTLNHLRETLGQLTGQTSSEREKALAMVTELEQNFTSVLSQLDKVSQQYEGKLGRLNETSGQIEERTKNLMNLTNGIDQQVENAASSVMGDLSRLESAVVELSQRSAAIAHLLERPVDSLERAAGQLDAHLRQSHGLLQSATQNLEKIGDVVMGRANSLVSGLSDRLSSMELVGAKLVSLGAAAQSDTGRFIGEIERVAERIRDYGAENEVKLRSVLADFSGYTDHSISQGDSLVERLRAGVDNLAAATRSNDGRFAELADEIEQRSSRLRELGRDARGQMEDVQVSLHNAYDGLEGQIDRLGSLTNRLQGEVGRADASAAAMSGVTEQARLGASQLLSLSEKTTDALGMIAHALENQQQQVGTLADDLTVRVEEMQQALKAQREELARTGSDLSAQGDVARVALREQVSAIGTASMEAAGKLDVLEQRVQAQAGSLGKLTAALSEKLEQLVASVTSSTGNLQQASHTLTDEQKAMLEGAQAAQQQLAALTTQLEDAQSSTNASLASVGQRLVGLRSDINAAEQELLAASGKLGSEQQSLQQRSEGLSTSLRDALGRLEQLTSQSDATRDSMGHIRGEIERSREVLVAENALVQTQLQALQAEMNQGQSQLDRVKAEASAATSLWQQAQEQMVGAEAQLKRSASNASDEVSAVQMQLETATESLGSAQQAAGQAYEALAEQSEQAQSRIAGLERDIASMQTMIGQLTSRSETLSRALSDQAAQAELASGKLQGATAVAQAATTELIKGNDLLQGSALAQASALEQLKAQIEAATRELTSQGELSQSGLNSLLAGVTSASATLATQAQTHKVAIGESQSALVAMRRELAEQGQTIRSDMTEIGSQMYNLKGELEQTSTQVLTVSAQMQEQGAHARSLREEVGLFASQAEAATSQLTSRVRELSDAAISQQEQASALQMQLEQLSGTLADSSTRGQADITALVQQLEQASSLLAKRSESGVEAISAVRASVNTSATELNEQAEQAGVLLERLATQGSTVRAVIEQAQEQGHELSRQLEAQHEQIEGVSGKSEALAGTARQQMVAMEDSYARLRDIASAAEKQAGIGYQSLVKVAQQFTETGEAAQHTIARVMEEALALTTTQTASAQHKLAALGAQIAELTDTATARISSLGAETTSAVADVAGRAGDKLAAVAAQAQNQVAEMAAHTRTQMAEAAAAVQNEMEATATAARLNMASTAEAATKNVEQSVATLDATGEKLGTHMQAAQATLVKLQAEIVAAAQQMGEGIGAQQRAIESALQAGQQRFGENAATTEAMTNARLAELEKLSARLQTLSDSVSSQIAELGTGAQGSETRMAQQRESLQQALTLIEQLSETSSQQTEQLGKLAGEIASQQQALMQAGEQAAEAQQLLVAQARHAQSGVREMAEQLGTTRALVDATADHTAARLADVSAGFATRIREGENAVQTATSRLHEVEQRMAETGTLMEQRQDKLMASTRELLQQLAIIEDSFDDVLGRSSTVQTQLATQAQHNQQLVAGLTQLGEMSAANLEEQSQRLAILAHQATADTQKMLALGSTVQQQQDELTQTAQAAAAVLYSVQEKVLKATAAGSEHLEVAGDKVAALLTTLTGRASELARHNEVLGTQLRSTTGQMAQAISLLHEGGRKLGTDLASVGEQLHSRALDMTAAGQQLDRELKTRLGTVQATQQEIEGIYGKATQRLAELDSRSQQYLIELDRSSQQSFGRLQAGVEAFRDVPLQMREAEALLHNQVGTARQEVMRLRSDLVELGQSVLAQADTASQTSSSWLGNLQQMSAQSSAMASQIDEATTRMAQAAQQAWQLVHQAVAESTSGLAGLHENLQGAESRSTTLAQQARQGIEGLLSRVAEMGQLIEGALTKANRSYAELAGGGLQQIEVLSRTLAGSASALEDSSSHAHERLMAASAIANQHQTAMAEAATVLGTKLQDVRTMLETVQSGLGNLDSRMVQLSPDLSQQTEQMKGFASSIDRTLVQVGSLQMLSRDMAQEHFSLATQLQQQEVALRSVANELDSRFDMVERRLSTGVLSQIANAADQAQAVEQTLASLMAQAQELDLTIGNIRSHATNQVTDRLLHASTSLVTAHTQLQRSSQLSESGLLQAQEETQRMTARMEQMRTLLKSLTGAIAADLSEWQSDMRKRLTGIAGELSNPAVRAQAPLPALAAAPRASASGSSTQLTTEALQAVAIDLYRLLRTEVPELLKGLPAPAARRGPMVPGEARTYTVGLLELAAGVFSQHARALYQNNLEFRQYVDRYLTRFEAHYDILARSAQGLEEAKGYRSSEVGRLYSLLSGAIERKAVISTDMSAAG